VLANFTSNAGRSERFNHPEYLNTPRLIADTTGTPVWKWDQTEPFGVNTPDENPSALGALEFPLRFPGQYADKETNLSYNYFRDCYDPALGRYCQSDPIGLAGGLNTFTYVLGAPLDGIDPFGLRDVVVAVWSRQVSDNSVGHVFVGELNGTVLLSLFPTPHGRHGANTNRNWYQTLGVEGRMPDRVFRVKVDDDAKFDAAVRELRERPYWDWQPVGRLMETNCTHAAYGALSAGGVRVPRPLILPLSPDDFLDGIESLVGRGNVTTLSTVPWKRK
jgi:RHS repeat-associated protein